MKDGWRGKGVWNANVNDKQDECENLEEDDFEIVLAPSADEEADSLPLSRFEQYVVGKASRDWIKGSRNIDVNKFFEMKLESEEEETEAFLRWRSLIALNVLEHEPAIVRKKLSILLYKGCPDAFRRDTWLSITGSREKYVKHESRVVAEWSSLQDRANEGSSMRQIMRPPLFGGNLDFSQHCLTESGKASCHFVLAAIDMSRPDLHHFSPQIPNFVSLALMFMSSEEVCMFIDSLTSCFDVSKGQANFLDNIFLQNLQSISFVMRAIDLKLKACDPEVWSKLQQLGMLKLKFCEEWIKDLFVGHCHLHIVLRIIDVVLSEGNMRSLIRVCVSFLRLGRSAILSSETPEAAEQELKEMLRDFRDAGLLMKTVHEIVQTAPVKVFDVQAAMVEGNVASGDHGETPDSDVEHECITYYLPKISSQPPVPCILNEDQLQTLWNWMPARERIRDGHIVFCTSRDGRSLSTLYRKVEGEWGGRDQKGLAPAPQCLVLISTLSGELFGSYLTQWPRVTSGGVLGTGESFVFSFAPLCKKYRWNPEQDTNFLTSRVDFFAIGGEAIYVERYLEKGSSGYSDTFSCPCLLLDAEATRADEPVRREFEIRTLQVVRLV